ncbi:MAG: YXWGXW repeat-containing protein [Pirellulales bacterium]|nr:YXWGXW repeat-containing protein [Pirellulales bacterium]
MNVRHVCKGCVAGALLALGLSFGLNGTLFAQAGPADAEQGVQVLTRGPVHEAFAETVTFDPEPGVVTPKAPPAAIEEVPPEQRLEGANVAWIPGYWAWDDERTDFLWVSGVWRALPPGRQWVPGYWGQSPEGFQWTSGYWADAQADEVEYLPEPPATVEAGPNIAASSADQTWLPGCWVWQNRRYAWRPGFWATAEPNWVWVPAHYVWAPRGYVYVDGYWDHALPRRGVLFAPVYFNRGAYARPGFSYSPSTVIDLGALTNHLFVRPRYQHYYFGDYYAANYRGAGFYPRYSVNTGRFGYDPIYAHDRWRHRQDREWEQRQQADFQNRRDHEDLRPPRTWAAQGLLNGSGATSRAGLPGVALLLDDLRRSKDYPQRFQPVDPSERQRFRQHAQEVQRLRDERHKLEVNAAGAPAEVRAKEVVPVRVRLPRSPIVAKPVAELDKDQVPPKTYAAPKPDANVQPKPRATRSAGSKQKGRQEKDKGKDTP